MNDEHVEEELLNRYFDGDLAPAHASEVAQHIERCASCAARHRALGELQRLIGIAAEDDGRQVDFDAVFGRIEGAVRRQPAPGLGERVSFELHDRVERRTALLWMPAAGALAAAAALALMLRSGNSQPAPRAVANGADPVQARVAPGSSEVEQVDFGAKTGTVFEVAVADGVSTPVVWIDDDGDQGAE